MPTNASGTEVITVPEGFGGTPFCNTTVSVFKKR
jgi:hypothetical protein